MAETAPPIATVDAAPARGMVTLRTDFGDAAVRSVVEAQGGVAFPGTREIRADGGRGLAWMAPDEVLIFVPDGGAAATVQALGSALAGTPHLVADVSDARALFRISGPGAREVLAKGAPVDLRPGRFEPGEIRRTRLGQVAAAFWMTDAATFELMCFRSVAKFVEDWLRHAARTGRVEGLFGDR